MFVVRLAGLEDDLAQWALDQAGSAASDAAGGNLDIDIPNLTIDLEAASAQAARYALDQAIDATSQPGYVPPPAVPPEAGSTPGVTTATPITGPVPITVPPMVPGTAPPVPPPQIRTRVVGSPSVALTAETVPQMSIYGQRAKGPSWWWAVAGAGVAAVILWR